MKETSTESEALAVEIIVKDCYYGFAAHLLMSDGTRRFQSGIKSTPDEALLETMRLAREASGAGGAE